MCRRVRALMRSGRLLMSTNWMPSVAASRSCPRAAVSSRGAVWGISVRLHKMPWRPTEHMPGHSNGLTTLHTVRAVLVFMQAGYCRGVLRMGWQ